MKTIISLFLKTLLSVTSCIKLEKIDPLDTKIPKTVTDIDGNVYNTFTIGTQIWMVENLKTTKYRNGDPIPNITIDATWAALTTGAYCWYYNDAPTYKATYGALYNWYAVADSRNIAPSSWHVATDAEWTTLTTLSWRRKLSGWQTKRSRHGTLASTQHWSNQ